MDITALHFGYQISKETFSVLWKQEDVSVSFDLKRRKIFFFLSHLYKEYKLEISYDSIWQIKLHRPRGQPTKFLLVQLLGAPKIHKKDVSRAHGHSSGSGKLISLHRVALANLLLYVWSFHRRVCSQNFMAILSIMKKMKANLFCTKGIISLAILVLSPL
ncbi:hypothetical protein SLA2020_272210 [Shorea laevis]